MFQKVLISPDNHRILTQKVQVPDEDGQTNNGTFTCTATNGVGSDASLSFQLQVYGNSVCNLSFLSLFNSVILAFDVVPIFVIA